MKQEDCGLNFPEDFKPDVDLKLEPGNCDFGSGELLLTLIWWWWWQCPIWYTAANNCLLEQLQGADWVQWLIVDVGHWISHAEQQLTNMKTLLSPAYLRLARWSYFLDILLLLTAGSEHSSLLIIMKSCCYLKLDQCKNAGRAGRVSGRRVLVCVHRWSGAGAGLEQWLADSRITVQTQLHCSHMPLTPLSHLTKSLKKCTTFYFFYQTHLPVNNSKNIFDQYLPRLSVLIYEKFSVIS